MPEENYLLTLLAGTSGGSNFVDLAGNALDGEFNGTFPSGNGLAGGDFVIGFSMDADSHIFPALHSQDNLIYDNSTKKTVDFPGDVDSFSLPVSPGQKVSVEVTPVSSSLQPGIQLVDPTGAVIGTAIASGVGQSAVLQSISTTDNSTGNYQVVVSGSGATTGIYSLQVTLNAAIENDPSPSAINNDTLGAAQDIDFSALPLSASSASLAVKGERQSRITWSLYRFRVRCFARIVHNLFYSLWTCVRLKHRRATTTVHLHWP